MKDWSRIIKKNLLIVIVMVAGLLISSCTKVDKEEVIIDKEEIENNIVVIDSLDNSEKEKEEENKIEIEEIENVVNNNEIEMSFDNIYWLQESLKIAGFYTTLDGLWGPNTKLKLNEFQLLVDGLKNSGIYDEKTKRILEDIRISKRVNNLGSDMILINKDYFLESGYIPDNLREVKVAKFKYMELQDHVVLKVEEMFADAKEDEYKFYFNSGYRSC